MPAKAKATYGAHHQKLRTQLIHQLNQLGSMPCARNCGQPIWPWQLVDLDHTDDRRGYRGLAHRACNRAAGARKGNTMRGIRRRLGYTTRQSRAW